MKGSRRARPSSGYGTGIRILQRFWAGMRQNFVLSVCMTVGAGGMYIWQLEQRPELMLASGPESMLAFVLPPRSCLCGA